MHGKSLTMYMYMYLSKGIIDAYLPHKTIKSIVKDEQLKALWKKWRATGHPPYGPLAEEKKVIKKNFGQLVATCTCSSS